MFGRKTTEEKLTAMRIDLGDEVQDEITGFRGIAIGCTIWLNSCNRWLVQPQIKPDATKLDDAQAFDEPNLKVITKAKVKSPKSIREVRVVDKTTEKERPVYDPYPGGPKSAALEAAAKRR